MNILLILLVGIGALIIGAVIWLSFLNGTYEILRSVEIKSDVSKIFEEISSFKNWHRWSPWLCMEPDAKVTLKGNKKGIGAIQDWEGELIGIGEMQNIKEEKDKTLIQEIRFQKPFQSVAEVFWNFEKTENNVKVSWGMRAKMPFFLRFMTKMMKTFIEMDYDRGLKMLKEFIETGKVDSNITIEGITAVEPFQFIGTRQECNKTDINKDMEDKFGQLETFFATKKIKPNRTLSQYHEMKKIMRGIFDYTSAFGYTEEIDVSNSQFYKGKIPQVEALKITFKGSYEHLGNAWATGISYLRAKKLKKNKKIAPFEIYLNSPKEVKNSADLVTEVYFPLN